MLNKNDILKSSGKKVLLYSGGLDSYILSKFIEPDVFLYCDLGLRDSESEKYWLLKSNKNIVIDNRFRQGDLQKSIAFTPLRATLMTCVASYYGEEIYIGALNGEAYLTHTDEFKTRMENLLTYMYSAFVEDQQKKIQIKTPLSNLYKGEIIDKYLSEVPGASLEKLAEDTFSCYNPTLDHQECGLCRHCVHKWITLMSRGYDMSYKFVTNTHPNKKFLKKIILEQHDRTKDTECGSPFDSKVINSLYIILKE